MHLTYFLVKFMRRRRSAFTKVISISTSIYWRVLYRIKEEYSTISLKALVNYMQCNIQDDETLHFKLLGNVYYFKTFCCHVHHAHECVIGYCPYTRIIHTNCIISHFSLYISYFVQYWHWACPLLVHVLICATVTMYGWFFLPSIACIGWFTLELIL